MTPAQLAAVLICGPLGLMLLANLGMIVTGKARKTFGLLDAFVMLLCFVLIVLSFVGVR